MSTLRIDDLLTYNRDSRKLRAYAYLTASFEATANTADTIDCLLPFLAAGAAQQADSFLDLDKLSVFLKGIGLTVPIYVLQQLVPRLQDMGIVEWNNAARRHLCKPVKANATASFSNTSDLGAAFEALEEAFTLYAATLGIERPPASAHWSDALITFLQSDTAGEVLKTAKVKDVLVGDTPGLESFLVARFIQDAQTREPETFKAIVQVFTGIMIEDFLINIQSVGESDRYHNLNIYYDTTVLLRLLGTSGSLLKTATLEMHRALQDLGCHCHYLEYTEEEIVRILETIISAHNSGNEIFGETAEAVLNREVSIGQLQDLVSTITERLTKELIFPFSYNYASKKSDDVYQIDERSLATALVAEASKRDRTYKEPSALNDARAVAIILRLRKGVARRDLNASGHVFVSRNPVLHVAAKRFVTRNVEGYEGQAIPPVLTVGHITTVAWLATAKTLTPHQVTKELLATCYNAVRPSANWTLEFSRALDQFRTENPGFIEARANAALFLQVARNSARDESLNQPAVLRKENVAEIFLRAAVAADMRQKEYQENFEREKQELEASSEARLQDAAAEALRKEREAEDLIRKMADQAAEDLADAERRSGENARTAATLAAEDIRRELLETDRQLRKALVENQAAALAMVVIRAVQLVTAIIIFVAALLFNLDYWAGGTATKVSSGILLAIIVLPSVLDLCGWEVVSGPIRHAQSKMASLLETPLSRWNGYTLVAAERKEPLLHPTPK